MKKRLNLKAAAAAAWFWVFFASAHVQEIKVNRRMRCVRSLALPLNKEVCKHFFLQNSIFLKANTSNILVRFPPGTIFVH